MVSRDGNGEWQGRVWSIVLDGSIVPTAATRMLAAKLMQTTQRSGAADAVLQHLDDCPIDQLPAWSQPIAHVTPLYHGVELTRGAVLGTLGVLAAIGHVAVLADYAGAGYALCRRTFTSRLER